MGDSDLDDDEAQLMWQEALDEVAAGRSRNLHCPFCQKGELGVTFDEQTKRTKVQCQNGSCKRFIEVRLSELIG